MKKLLIYSIVIATFSLGNTQAVVPEELNSIATKKEKRQLLEEKENYLNNLRTLASQARDKQVKLIRKRMKIMFSKDEIKEQAYEELSIKYDKLVEELDEKIYNESIKKNKLFFEAYIL